METSPPYNPVLLKTMTKIVTDEVRKKLIQEFSILFSTLIFLQLHLDNWFVLLLRIEITNTTQLEWFLVSKE